jgi:hypothetical protein
MRSDSETLLSARASSLEGSNHGATMSTSSDDVGPFPVASFIFPSRADNTAARLFQHMRLLSAVAFVHDPREILTSEGCLAARTNRRFRCRLCRDSP